MIQLGLKFVFEIYGAKRASLGVFENNLALLIIVIEQLGFTMWFLICPKHIKFQAKNGYVRN